MDKASAVPGPPTALPSLVPSGQDPAELHRRTYPTLAGGHLVPGSDANGDFDGVEVDEVADLVVGDAPELCPGAESPDRRLLADGKYPALAEAGDVGKLTFKNGR